MGTLALTLALWSAGVAAGLPEVKPSPPPSSRVAAPRLPALAGPGLARPLGGPAGLAVHVTGAPELEAEAESEDSGALPWIVAAAALVVGAGVAVALAFGTQGGPTLDDGTGTIRGTY